MRENTTHMRVPRSFKAEIERISSKMGKPMTDMLQEDGIRLFQNADYLGDLIGLYRRRRK